MPFMSNRPLQTGKAFALSALGPHGVAWWLKLIFVGMALSLHQPATAEESQRILPQGIPGTLWLAGGGEFPSELRETFCKLAGAKEAKLVIIPTASSRSEETEDLQTWLEPWQKSELGSTHVLHIDEGGQPDKEDQQLLENATAIWFSGGSQGRLASRIVGTRWEELVVDILNRGGLVGGTSAGAAIQSKIMIARGNPIPEISQGLDLLPDAIVDQHFTQRERQGRLSQAILKNPDRFGLGIDEGTAVIVRGRTMFAMGKGSATILLAQTDARPEATWSISQGERADLTAIRRMVANRSTADFPHGVAHSPVLKSGALIIVGGGGLPEKVTQKFIELAGGQDAHIVVLPTAAPDPLPQRHGIAELFRRAGAGTVTVLPQREKEEVESEAFLKTLDEATGIWFGGGRQWRFVDAYANTEAEKAFHRLLERGGVIAGSSAGASIQGEYMARGNPLGNLDIMSEGYEKGLGFLPGVAIDQHFTQRSRMKDMKALVKTYPQFLGIGIDETTAILVEGTKATVMGKNDVYFLSGAAQDSESDPRSESSIDQLSDGGVYDLEKKEIIVEAKPDSSE